MLKICTLGRTFNVDIDIDAIARENSLSKADEKVKAALAPTFDAITKILCGLVALKRLIGNDED